MENMDFSEETIKDLIQLIQDPKYEVKKQALCLILQFTTTKENRAYFIESNISKILLKSLNMQGLETICLSNLINLTEEQEFCSQLIELNAIEKLIYGIKEIMLIQIGNDILQIDDKQKLQIELSLLVMSNLCQKGEGISQFLQLESSETKGIYFKMLCELFCHPKFQESFHFFGNILANISSQEIGRKYFMKKIVGYMFSNNISRRQHLYCLFKVQLFRIGVLKLIKNCLFEFEFEDFQKQICNSDLIDSACKYILNLFLKGKLYSQILGLSEISKRYNLTEENLFVNISPNEQEEYELALDLILIQTNIPDIEKIAVYQKQGLKQIMFLLQQVLKSQDLLDKILVITTIFNL